MKTARQIALESLNRMEKQQAYSNLMMESLLKHSDLDSRDRDFASKLFYGVLESKITLDYIITCYSKHPIEKMTIEIRKILRLGLYQMISLQVDDFAAVNESVTVNFASKSIKNYKRGTFHPIRRRRIYLKTPSNGKLC